MEPGDGDGEVGTTGGLVERDLETKGRGQPPRQLVRRGFDAGQTAGREQPGRKAWPGGDAERISDGGGAIRGRAGAYHGHGLRGHGSGKARVEACRRAGRLSADFLVCSQLPNGEFRSLLSTDFDLCRDVVADPSPFVTTFVLHSLRLYQGPGLEGAIEKALGFLLQEQDEHGFWSYWTRATPKRSLVPPDVDDTSCASWVLSSYGRSFRHNRTAVAANRDREGRFMTWLGPDEEENDVDGVVNANVVLYLGGGQETEAACEYLSRLVESPESELGSWYYPDPLSLDHAVSRAAWHGATSLRGCRERLLARVSDRCTGTGHPQNPLGAALAALTLLNCEAEVDLLDRQMDVILSSQRDDGSWPRVAFYSGPRPPLPRSVWFGSEELTTALCLEAVVRYSSLD
jgi:hypothetical protein